MLRKAFNFLILLPLALALVIFAVANRHIVRVSFDPFDTADPALGLSMPLFLVVLLAVILGVVAGGFAGWFRQRHWRRTARQHERDAREARRLLETQNAHAFARPMTATSERLRLPAR